MMPERREPGQPAIRDVAARGARIRFAEVGKGRPLLLVHDFLASRVAWDDVVGPFAERFRVIAPDLPGFGESEKPPPRRYAYGFDAFAESLVDLVASTGLVRVSVCGHGMGGGVALTLAATHGHLLDKLVLVNPPIYPPRPDALARIATLPIVGPVLFKQLLGRTLFRGRLLGSARSNGAPERRLDHLFDLFDAPAAREAALATMIATLDTRRLTAIVPRVTTPTLIVWGRDHPRSPVDQGRRLARELGGARFEVLDCGTSPAEERPDAFAASVIAFLQRRVGA